MEFFAVSDRVGNEISSKAFFYGYIAAVCELIVAAAFVVYAKSKNNFGLSETYPMQISIAAICVWQLLIILRYTRPLMKTRPGPPLPAGENYFSFSIKNLIKTCRQAHRLTQLFKFLFAWFIYSDSFSTTISAAVLFAQSELGASTSILLASAIIVPLFAGIGNILWVKFQKKFNLTTQQVLLMQCGLYSLLPLYGVLGFLVPSGTYFGLQNKYEIPIIGIANGLLLGATQSSCRVMFSELLPKGHESEFFGLYEITDKGSSWLGPLFVGIIANATGSIRYSFFMLFFFFTAPILLFWSLDLTLGKEEARKFVEKEERHHFGDFKNKK